MTLRRDLSLERYGISRAAYTELRGFCLRYTEMVIQIATDSDLSAIELTGLPHGTDTSDPTGQKAAKLEKLIADKNMIEETAREVGDDLAGYLLRWVTTRISYEALNIPCGRATAFRLRRKFFWTLAAKKGMV